VRTLLVPSAVVLLGRISWWPSRLADLVPEVHGSTREEQRELEGQRV